MAPVGEKYKSFLYSFHSNNKWLIWRLEQIKDRIYRHEVAFIVSNQIHTHIENSLDKTND